MKNAPKAAIAGTPTPNPTARPIVFPVLDGESAAVGLVAGLDVGLNAGFAVALDVGLDTRVEAMFGPEVAGLLDVALDIPIVAARVTRSSIAQHVSESISPPQHQVPSIEHCDIAAVEFADPPFYPH